MDLLEKAGYEYNNDDALWTLANMYFVSAMPMLTLVSMRMLCESLTAMHVLTPSFPVYKIAWTIQDQTRFGAGFRHVCSTGGSVRKRDSAADGWIYVLDWTWQCRGEG